MNRLEFMKDLEHQLKLQNVEDIDEILLEFSEHFDYKTELGKTEEEIAKKLGNPLDIAREYSLQNINHNKESSNVMKWIGISFLHLFIYPIFIMIWITMIVFVAFSIALLTIGFCMLLKLNIASIIPSMPYLSAMFLGVSLIGGSLLSAIGSYYMAIYVKQWMITYYHWSKKILNKEVFTSLSLHPKLAKKTSAKLKLMLIVSTIIFITFFTIGYIVSVILANSFEFWHVWGWFVG